VITFEYFVVKSKFIEPQRITKYNTKEHKGEKSKKSSFSTTPAGGVNGFGFFGNGPD
jgi:hypothetical protein